MCWGPSHPYRGREYFWISSLSQVSLPEASLSVGDTTGKEAQQAAKMRCLAGIPTWAGCLHKMSRGAQARDTHQQS